VAPDNLASAKPQQTIVSHSAQTAWPKKKTQQHQRVTATVHYLTLLHDDTMNERGVNHGNSST
jgi:hypothetical protein